MKRLAINLFTLFCLSFSLLTAADWPQWRGPDRNGLQTGKLPDAWPKALKLTWEVPAGEGYAGPLVKDGRVYVFSREGDQERVTAYHLADGKSLWRDQYPAPFKQSDMAKQHGNGPFATPALDDETMYTLGMTEVLSAYDLKTGNLQWRVDFVKDHNGGGNEFGSACSPLISGNRLFVQVAKGKGGAIIALDKKSGKILWQKKNKGPASSPPAAAVIGGTPMIVAKSTEKLAGFQPHDGQILWEAEYRIRYDHPVVDPLIWDNQLLLADYNRETSLVKLEKTSQGWQKKVAWQNKAVNMFMSTPVKVNQRIFGLSQKSKGQYFCMDAKSGAIIWESEGRMGKNAMLAGHDTAVFGLTPDGQLRVIDPHANELKILATYQISDLPTWSFPAILPEGVLVKDTENLRFLSWRTM